MASDHESTPSGWSSATEEDDIDIAAYPTPKLEASEDDGYLTGEDTSNPDSTEPEQPSAVIMAARAYQLEMLEESLKGNIIVAMDTGSGKTQVAVLRIQAELERSHKSEYQRIWFMAPTVVLVDQQLERIEEQIPHIIAKRLCGDDNVDTWSTQKIWNAFLQNVRVVVSTPDVLLDALKHGFVRITSLSLIVFDEAHNCKGRNGGARIMKEFYGPAKAQGLKVPHILGLTASPIISTSKEDLDILETTLDARCRAPKRHREELLAHVKIPEMSIVGYGPPESVSRASNTRSMTSLFKAFANMDIGKDPAILRLRARRTERARLELGRRLLQNDTPTFQTMKSFCHSSTAIMQQLGPWAADLYIHKVVSEFLSDVFTHDNADARYLGTIISAIDAPAPPSTPTNISRKMERLIQTLGSYEGDITGIVFAEERTTVVVMTQLLLQHPTTRDRFRVASMVGSSSYGNKKRKLLEPNNGDAQDALQRFRRGKVNLLVATTVIEEGIDVPACNVVICFEKPKTLKSFTQRRGRARTNTSKLILLLDDQSTGDANEWRALELEMKMKYEDESRQIQIIHEVEESEHPDYPPLEVESEDGHLARLTIDDAKSHLEHFCATLSARKFVDFSPYYTIRAVGDEKDNLSPSALLRATVHLPVSLPPTLRRADSLREWKSEQNARKDAAFQAYQALYAAGLVNDHLLPLRESDIFKDFEAREGTTLVWEQLDPWPMVAKAWQDNRPLDSRVLRLSDEDGTEQAEFDLLLPVPIPQLPVLTLYWDANSAWTVTMANSPERHYTQMNMGSPPRNDMETLITLAYGHRGGRYAVTNKTHMLCMLSRAFPLSHTGIGARDLDRGYLDAHPKDHLIRDTMRSNHPYFYAGWLPSRPPAEQVGKWAFEKDDHPPDVPYVVMKDWPKKAFGFHRPANDQQPQPVITKPYPRVLPATVVKVDAIPSTYARFAMCVPSLFSALEVYFVAAELQTQRLEQLELSDLEMVATAICAPNARMPMNYEKVELLGDCILKLAATSNALAQHPDWPEGLLSLMKDTFVSNSRLAKASIDFGLDRYIVHKAPSQEKWKPPYVEDHLQLSPYEEPKRLLSTKILADVVEALVGVSYLDGGLPKALDCISLFLRQGDWQSPDQAREALFHAAPADDPLPPAMEPLERLIGYSFTRKSLLVEAMTHSSYRVPGTHACLERLEFFGDSILDYLIVRLLFAASWAGRPLAHWEIHLIKTTLVNGDFLAFRAMEWSIEVPCNDVVADDPENEPVTIEAATTRLPLWSFMRYSCNELTLSQRATRRRHAALRESINAALKGGDRHPWALMVRLQAQKYYSDLFESLLGAVYVDSGSFEECDKILERAGILPYLERMLKDKVKAWHPKEELGKLAVSEKVDYVIDARLSEDDSGGPPTWEFSCRLLVGDKVVANVSGGVSREEAKTRAAEEAIRSYESLGGRF